MQADPPACFLRACALDVAVAKPGNVSLASPGHGMLAAQFLASAQAAVGPLFERGARVGRRIEAAMAATWAAAGCNTNLGILLLCAPVALAIEREPGPHTTRSLRAAIESVLAGLDVDDAAAAYRGIALANPGGLGTAAEQDVHEAPSITLRQAMALAGERDLIARQYRDGYAELFEIGLASLPTDFVLRPGAPPAQAAMPGSKTADDGRVEAAFGDPATESCETGLRAFATAADAVAVQRLYLALLSRLPDSHIVRKHGEAVAQNVMRSAQGFAGRAAAGESLLADPAFAAWDAELKAARINPGTTADFTVATLLLAGLAQRIGHPVEGSG